MHVHKALTAAILATGLSVAGSSMAASTTGRITNYHLNADIPDRGVCVRMSPSLPGGGWACLWKSNSLYSEITELLLQGLVNDRTCTVVYNTTGPTGQNLISVAECH